MANAKQDGSNLINVEYSTGRCKTTCEQCFVNFGQQGQATCRGTVNPGHEKLIAWLDEQPGYAKIPTFTHGPPEPGREWLLRKITESGRGFYNMPTLGAFDNWVVKSPTKKKMFDVVSGVEHLGPMPFFLRVSSMSDSSYAPLDWIDSVRAAWGDQCFFNSAIRSIEKTRNTGVMDHYHKLVVTLNPGQQNVNKFRPATSRADTKPARTKEANAWKRAVNKAGDFPYMSMGKAVDVPMDFLHPKTLTDIGLGQYEKIIKFYRLRALPTIRGHFATDRPVVITQMRFKSLYHAFEWCRRYKLNFEVRLPTRLYEKKDFFFPWAVSKFKLTPKVVKHDRELDVVELHIWSDRNDTRNASPYRGEACVYIYEGSYWRTADTDGFNADPYVCDRMHGGCSHCGLCASLDGTGPTIQGVKFCNELNVLQGHLLAPFPGPEGAGYLGFLRGEHVETDEETGKKVKKAAGCDLFAANLQKLGIEADVPMALRGWAANPQEPADLDDALVLLQSAADYLQKVDGPYFCEGWNTHENAETSIAFAAFSVMCYAKQQGWDCDKALTLLYEVADAASPDFDMLDDMDGLDEDLWEGVSPWNDVFGEVG